MSQYEIGQEVVVVRGRLTGADWLSVREVVSIWKNGVVVLDDKTKWGTDSYRWGRGSSFTGRGHIRPLADDETRESVEEKDLQRQLDKTAEKQTAAEKRLAHLRGTYAEWRQVIKDAETSELGNYVSRNLVIPAKDGWRSREGYVSYVTFWVQTVTAQEIDWEKYRELVKDNRELADDEIPYLPAMNVTVHYSAVVLNAEGSRSSSSSHYITEQSEGDTGESLQEAWELAIAQMLENVLSM